MRGPIWGILLVTGAALPGAIAARAACNGPQELAARFRAHPSTANAVKLGNWFASHKQFECAVATFQTALKSDSQSAQLNYLTGLALIGDGHPAEALPALEESERLQPEVLKPHLMLAYMYGQTRQAQKAQDEWKLALKIDPHSEQALEGLSNQLLNQQDYIGVVELLQGAPRTEKLAINLSKALGLLGHLDEAKAALQEGLAQSPNSVPLASALTVVLVKQTHYQEAVDLLRKTVQANPGSQDAQVELYRLLVLTGRNDEARPMGPKLLAERPRDPEVLYLNGVVERIVGETTQSKAHLEQAVALDPNFPNSHYNLGKVLVVLKEYAEAKVQLEKAIELGATGPEVHYELAMTLRGLGETELAGQELKKYQEGKKADEALVEASMSSSQADKELSDGKVQEAIRDYRSACETVPTDAGYKYKLAMALHKSGDTEGEQAQLVEAVKLNPEIAGAQKELGYLLARSGDSAGAIEHFRLAVKAAPAWSEAWINLGAALAEAGQFAEARSAAATAVHLDPQNAAAKELSDQLARDPSAQQATP